VAGSPSGRSSAAPLRRKGRVGRDAAERPAAWTAQEGHTHVVKERPDLRIVDQATWDAVQILLKKRGDAYSGRLGQTLRAAELSANTTTCGAGSSSAGSAEARCSWGRRPTGRRCKAGTAARTRPARDSVCDNGVYAQVDALDAALLDGVEKAVLDPVALRYVLDKAAADVRRTLTEDPRRIATLQKRRAECSEDKQAGGCGGRRKAPRAVLDQIQALEAELDRLDGAIAALEARGHLGYLDVARACTSWSPPLSPGRTSSGKPGPARQVLKKIVAGRSDGAATRGSGYGAGQLNSGRSWKGRKNTFRSGDRHPNYARHFHCEAMEA